MKRCGGHSRCKGACEKPRARPESSGRTAVIAGCNGMAPEKMDRANSTKISPKPQTPTGFFRTVAENGTMIRRLQTAATKPRIASPFHPPSHPSSPQQRPPQPPKKGDQGRLNNQSLVANCHTIIDYTSTHSVPHRENITTSVMRPTTRLLASAARPGPANPLRPDHLPLLPPIPLYRRLLRAHRKHLPPQMRLLGDEYVKAEFRAHRNVENPAHLVSSP